MNKSILSARKFSEEEKKKWRDGIMDIYDRMRERASGGKYEVTFGDIKLEVLPNVYDPVGFTDTLWFAQQVREIVGTKSLLEIGTGSGAIAVYCALNGASVVATDINPDAVENALLNAKKNDVNVSVRLGDLYMVLASDEKFDFIFWAHPFNNWETPVEDMLLRSGLDHQYESLKGYISGAKNHLAQNGKLLLGTGDSADLETIESAAKDSGYSLKLIKEITMPLEENGEVVITDLLYEFVPLS